MNFFRPFVFAVVLNLGWGVPAMAQKASPGPVQFPAGYATNAPAVVAAPSSGPTPAAAPPSAPTAAPSAPSSAEDIRDIRGPISIPYQWLWAAYVLAGVIVAVLAYALWRWIRGRARIKARLPHEIALDRLEAARALMTENQVREYAFTVSEIIRSYIEQRFGERAAHRTTEEFLSDLLQQRGTPLAEHRARLEDFLNHCDLPKFARWQLSVREMESMHESARAFILDTQPQPQPAKAITPVQPELVPVK